MSKSYEEKKQILFRNVAACIAGLIVVWLFLTFAPLYDIFEEMKVSNVSNTLPQIMRSYTTVMIFACFFIFVIAFYIVKKVMLDYQNKGKKSKKVKTKTATAAAPHSVSNVHTHVNKVVAAPTNMPQRDHTSNVSQRVQTTHTSNAQPSNLHTNVAVKKDTDTVEHTSLTSNNSKKSDYNEVKTIPKSDFNSKMHELNHKHVHSKTQSVYERNESAADKIPIPRFEEPSFERGNNVRGSQYHNTNIHVPINEKKVEISEQKNEATAQSPSYQYNRTVNTVDKPKYIDSEVKTSESKPFSRNTQNHREQSQRNEVVSNVEENKQTHNDQHNKVDNSKSKFENKEDTDQKLNTNNTATTNTNINYSNIYNNNIQDNTNSDAKKTLDLEEKSLFENKYLSKYARDYKKDEEIKIELSDEEEILKENPLNNKEEKTPNTYGKYDEKSFENRYSKNEDIKIDIEPKKNEHEDKTQGIKENIVNDEKNSKGNEVKNTNTNMYIEDEVRENLKDIAQKKLANSNIHEYKVYGKDDIVKQIKKQDIKMPEIKKQTSDQQKEEILNKLKEESLKKDYTHENKEKTNNMPEPKLDFDFDPTSNVNPDLLEDMRSNIKDSILNIKKGDSSDTDEENYGKNI